jgi:hypothetical protein
MTSIAPVESDSVALVPTSAAQQLAPTNMPQPIDKKALRSYLALISDPEALALQNELAGAYDRACLALLGENDVQIEGTRSFKKKSAWQKLGRYFGISSTIIEQRKGYINDAATGESVFVSTCTVRAVAPWGQVGDAVGACGTDEESGRRKITIADSIATAQTRATNRAISNLIAMGEVSAEELSRTASSDVTQQATRELTLDEAKAYPFPWSKPEKYKGKPLGELSHGMLVTVLEAVEKEIHEKGMTTKRGELGQACTLVIADIETHPDAYPEKQRPKPAAAEKPAAETASASAPGEPPAAAQPAVTPLYVVTDGSGYDHLTLAANAPKTLCDQDIKKTWKRKAEPTTIDACDAERTCELCVLAAPDDTATS